MPNGLPRTQALAQRRDKDAWGVIHDPGTDRGGAGSHGSGTHHVGGGGAERASFDASWPPIFAATNAISYVFRGSPDDDR
jgi:hypothetical protein